MCQTCLRDDNAPETLVPIVGMVCGDCMRKLESAGIAGPTGLAQRTLEEFQERRETMIRTAKQVAKRA